MRDKKCPEINDPLEPIPGTEALLKVLQPHQHSREQGREREPRNIIETAYLEPWERTYRKNAETSPLSQPIRRGSVFIALFILFLCTAFSLYYWNNPNQPYTFLNKVDLKSGYWWQLVTSLFTHGDIGHLLSNTMLLLFFGTILNSYFGWIAFPLLPLILGVATNFIAIGLYGENVRLMGISGVIYAMVSMWLVLFNRYATHISSKQKFSRIIAFCLVMLVPSAIKPQVSYLAHGVGFALGIIAIYCVAMEPISRSPSIAQGEGQQIQN